MVNHPAHWRQRASKSRHLAEQASDPVVKSTMRDIAVSFERLAIHAEASAFRRQGRLAKERKAGTSTVLLHPAA